MIYRRYRLVLLLVSIALIADCAGGGASSSVPHAPTASGSSGVRFTITIPKAGTAGARRSPAYISPATASLTVTIATNPGGTVVTNETVALTTTSTGCSSTLASTLCTLSIALPPGAYTASISTADASSNVLSQEQSVPFTVTVGQTNTVLLVLNGVPASLTVSSSAPAVHGNMAPGFTLYGLSAQKFQIEALDADGNIIVGLGSPALSIASLSGSGFTIANPTATMPNTAMLTPPGTNGSQEIFTATATYSDNTCSLPGAVCSATFRVTNDVQTLFIANYDANNVLTYTAPYTGAPATISTDVNEPYALALDAGNNLFVSNYGNNTVTIYAPPYTGSPTTTVSTDLNGPAGIALDAVGNLFVANSNSNAVLVYAPPYTGAPTTVATGVNEPFYIALDASADLFVANYGNNTVTEYAPPYTGSPEVTITNGVTKPSGLALNALGELAVVDFNGPGATVYAPPYSGAPTTTSTGLPGNEAVDFDASNNLYVASNEGDAVVGFAPPYTGSPIATTTNGINAPVALAFDGAGNLWVVDVGRANVTAYALPYTSAPAVTISGLNGPQALVFTP
jgi:hypothetical protein